MSGVSTQTRSSIDKRVTLATISLFVFCFLFFVFYFYFFDSLFEKKKKNLKKKTKNFLRSFKSYNLKKPLKP